MTTLLVCPNCGAPLVGSAPRDDGAGAGYDPTGGRPDEPALVREVERILAAAGFARAQARGEPEFGYTTGALLDYVKPVGDMPEAVEIRHWDDQDSPWVEVTQMGRLLHWTALIGYEPPLLVTGLLVDLVVGDEEARPHLLVRRANPPVTPGHDQYETMFPDTGLTERMPALAGVGNTWVAGYGFLPTALLPTWEGINHG